MLRAKVAEVVEAVNVRVGEEVKEGQVLVELRRTDLEAAIQAARTADTEASNNYERYQKLAAQSVVSQEKLEQSRTAKERAASLLREAESRLQYAQLISPIDGIVSERWVEPGEYKREGDQLLSVVDLSTLEVSALVPEQDVANLRPGMAGEFQLESGTEWFTGQIRRISPSTTDPNRFFDVFLKVENRRTNGAWAMRPGMYAQARFARGTVNGAVAVPDDTIVREGNEQVVYTVEDGTARFPVEGKADTAGGFLSRLKRGWGRLAPRQGAADAQTYEQKPAKTARRVVVTTGLREGELVQVLHGDVKPGSLVIVNVSDDIRDGTVVHIVKGGQ